MKIGFFDVEDWAVVKIKEKISDAAINSDKLSIENVDKFSDLEVVAVFIYSDLSKPVLEKLPYLKMIATMSTGYDHIDIDYCRQKGIVVCNVPVYGERTVAEHTFGLMLTLTRKLYDSINRTRDGKFNVIGLRGVDLNQKTIGIIGLGNIGIEVLQIAQAFGMKPIVYTRTQKPELAQQYKFEYVTLEDLLKRADVVTMHLPYNQETHHIINKTNILLMKKGSYLINTARGGLVETEALLLALEKNILAGIGLDVLENEVDLREEAQLLSTIFRKEIDYKNLTFEHILLDHPKVIITPHNAFNSQEALERILQTTINNIQAFISGKPENIITL